MERKIAVYGSLREGFGNHRLIEMYDGEKVKTETVKVPYKMVSLGGFPGLVPSDDEKDVVIEIYNVSEECYKAVERLEGYPSFYQKAEVATSEGTVELYTLENDNYSGLPEVESGDWKQHNKRHY